MEFNQSITGPTSLLQQFAVKCTNKSPVFGDRAITYNRCSSEKQDSVEWQAKITATYVKQKNWQLVKSFGAKESAKTDDRKEFQEMLTFSRKQKVSHIVFYSYDRFSRTGNVGLIDELRNEDGIKVHSATQEVNDETAAGRMMQKFYLILAQSENEDRRQKVIEGQRNKLRKGEWIGKPTVGYYKEILPDKQRENKVKPRTLINEFGPLITQAFIWKDTESLNNVEILKRLKAMGLILQLPQLTSIFRNIFYCGYITHSLLNEGEIIKGKHEPLIDEGTFFRVNGLLKQKNGVGRKNLNRQEEMPLKGLLKCSKCDRLLTGYFQKKVYLYYKCPNPGCCVNINSVKITKLFLDQLSVIQIQPALSSLINRQLMLLHDALHQNDTVRLKPMKDELARLKTDLEKIELNFATGKLSIELYEKHSRSHEDNIYEIQSELEILNKDTSNLSNYLDKSLQIAENLLKMWENLDYNGKVRLQKLVFPEGIAYESEKHAVRTLAINPIFEAISSISNFLPSGMKANTVIKTELLSQLYLMFGSSNYLWENLEETARTTKELMEQLVLNKIPVVSVTGEQPAFSAYTSTQQPFLSAGFCGLASTTNEIFSGFTGQHLYHQ